MAVTNRSLHQPAPRRLTGEIPWPSRLKQLVRYTRIGLWILIAFICLSVASSRGKIWVDDLRYGRPRTQHLMGMVGHNEGSGQPTRFIAMNLNRRIVVIELPGGDVEKAKAVQGPYLFGVDEDLTAVDLRLHDMNRDGKNDLILAVKQEEIIYINTGESFRLINADERQQLEQVR